MCAMPSFRDCAETRASGEESGGAASTLKRTHSEGTDLETVTLDESPTKRDRAGTTSM